MYYVKMTSVRYPWQLLRPEVLGVELLIPPMCVIIFFWPIDMNVPVLLGLVALKLDLEIEIDFSWLQIVPFLFQSFSGYLLIHLSYVHVNHWKCSISAIDSEMVTENENRRIPSKMQSVGLKFHQKFLKKLWGVHNSQFIIFQCCIYYYKVLCSCSRQDIYERDRVCKIQVLQWRASRFLFSKHLICICPSEHRWHNAQWQLPLSDIENLRDILWRSQPAHFLCPLHEHNASQQ